MCVFHEFEYFVSRGIIFSQQGVTYRVLISNISALWIKEVLLSKIAYALSVSRSNIKLRRCQTTLKLNIHAFGSYIFKAIKFASFNYRLVQT